MTARTAVAARPARRQSVPAAQRAAAVGRRLPRLCRASAASAAWLTAHTTSRRGGPAVMIRARRERRSGTRPQQQQQQTPPRQPPQRRLLPKPQHHIPPRPPLQGRRRRRTFSLPAKSCCRSVREWQSSIAGSSSRLRSSHAVACQSRFLTRTYPPPSPASGGSDWEAVCPGASAVEATQHVAAATPRPCCRSRCWMWARVYVRARAAPSRGGRRLRSCQRGCRVACHCGRAAAAILAALLRPRLRAWLPPQPQLPLPRPWQLLPLPLSLRLLLTWAAEEIDRMTRRRKSLQLRQTSLPAAAARRALAGAPAAPLRLSAAAAAASSSHAAPSARRRRRRACAARSTAG